MLDLMSLQLWQSALEGPCKCQVATKTFLMSLKLPQELIDLMFYHSLSSVKFRIYEFLILYTCIYTHTNYLILGQKLIL